MGRKKKCFQTVATQTMPLVYLVPQVSIKRLTSNEIRNFTSRCIPIKDAMAISEQTSVNTTFYDEMVGRVNVNDVFAVPRRTKKPPTAIKSVPRTYKNFAKPITNDAKANSTFDAQPEETAAIAEPEPAQLSKILEEPELQESNHDEAATSKTNMVTVRKPRLTRANSDILPNPSPPSASEEMVQRNCPIEQALRPEISSIDSPVASPLLPLSFSTNMSPNFSPCDQGTQTDNDIQLLLERNISFMCNNSTGSCSKTPCDDNQLLDESGNIEGTGNGRSKTAKKVKFQCETERISAGLNNRLSPTNLSMEDENEEQDEDEPVEEANKEERNDNHKNYFNIVRSTVHINNYFYKQ